MTAPLPSTVTLDTHFHLDLSADPAATVRQIDAARVYTVAVTNTPSVFPATEKLVRRSKYVRAALGFHPELAVERVTELALFRRYLDQTRYVGEVGLDYVTSIERDRRTQRRVFEEVIALCRAAGRKVLTIHSRRAAADVVEVVGADFPGAWILHWYSGSRTVLSRAINMGAYISVNSAMADSDKSESLVRAIPPDRVLIESDGPFISIDGRPATPMALSGVVGRLAEWWRVDIAEAQSRLSTNARNLLQ